MMRTIRLVLGLLILTASVAVFLYGLLKTMQYGSCASGGVYVSTRQCSPDTALWTFMLIGGVLFGLVGAGVAFTRNYRPDRRQAPPVPHFEMPRSFPLAASSVSGAAQDPLVMLERLNALRTSGALSESEFERLKAAIIPER